MHVKIQWFQKAKIRVKFTHDIMLDGDTIHLSFFCPSLTYQTYPVTF